MKPTLPSKYRLIGSPIGTGGFGMVYKAMVRDESGTLQGPVALKIVDTQQISKIYGISEANIVKNLDHEVKILKSLSAECKNHFVLCYYDSYYDEFAGIYYIETELINGVDMFDFVQMQNISEDMKLYYLLLIARDVSIGLKYIHDHGYIHNDIKLENIMIDINKNEPRIVYTPVVIDLGLACEMSSGSCINNTGTDIYMPPESLISGPEGIRRYPAGDMWALGVILYSGAKNRFPFRNGKIAIEYPQEKYPRLDTSNELLNTIVNGLLQKDRNVRLTAEQIIELTDNI